MRLYDSLSTEILDVPKNKVINIYTCGPTVYDYIHIGNARPLILTDLIIRVLKYQNYKVNYLLNITDIDDKIINIALLKNKNETEISTFYYNEFLKDFKEMNLNFPNKILKVTDNIEKFIIYIDKLIKNKFAYINSGNVIFDINKYNKYGNLSKNNLSNLLNNNKKTQNKINNSDFLLWKNTTKGIQWNSNWSKGRPGWHLECAVFIYNYFKKDLDIHIGGSDLKFPHHENERAIFFGNNNSEISKIWLHNGLLNIKNQKMSKSLKNYFFVKDFIDKYDLNVLKYIFYTKRFLQPLNINDDLILFSQKELKKINNLILKFDSEYNLKNILKDESNNIETNKLFNIFLSELNNNLNTANALEILKKMIKIININLKDKKINLIMYQKFSDVLNILGFTFDNLKLKNKNLNIFDN